jgi:hypothetical protein
MPVLLLARGDKEGRDLLRKALQARYGLGAPALETLIIRLEGRARVKVGPLTTWASLQTALHFAFPGRARWDSTIRALGMTIRTSSSTLEGGTYRKREGNDPVQIIEKPEWVRAARLRLAAATGMLLTPLAEQSIELKATGERSFEAANTETQDTLHVTLHEDYTVDTISTMCLNPDQNFSEQLFSLQASAGQIALNDLMLPGKVAVSWNNVSKYEVAPVAVEMNPTFDDSVFRLEARPQG